MKNLTTESDLSFSDAPLMLDLVRQDSAALEQIYARHRAVLRGVVLRVLGDEVEADDVLQEVFLQLWTRAANYSPVKGRLLGWLVTLARRRAIDRLRQRAAYQRATDRFEVEFRRPAGGGRELLPAETANCEEAMRELVGGALLRLPASQREAVRCAYFEGMSQRQIAAALQLPLGTVKTRIELGLRKLGSLLAASRREFF